MAGRRRALPLTNTLRVPRPSSAWAGIFCSNHQKRCHPERNGTTLCFGTNCCFRGFNNLPADLGLLGSVSESAVVEVVSAERLITPTYILRSGPSLLGGG